MRNILIGKSRLSALCAAVVIGSIFAPAVFVSAAPRDDRAPGLPAGLDAATEPSGAVAAGCNPTLPVVDCNLNGVPDECDLLSGTSVDVDGDGVPDDCGKFYMTTRDASKDGEGGANTIVRANLDGSHGEVIATDYGDVALDIANGKMYWAGFDSGTIFRANLDGSGQEDILVKGERGPGALALDLVAGKMYWVDGFLQVIRRANLDGSNVEDLLTPTSANLPFLAIDHYGGKMYWADFGARTLERADLSGANREMVHSFLSGCPGGLALDPCAGHVYWSQRTTGPLGIKRANLDGTNVQPVVNGFFSSIALDLDRGKMYLTTVLTVESANLDGTDLQTLDIAGFGFVDAITVDTGILGCNANGIPDACDVLAGFSADINSNGVPDECESVEDCNNNGILDPEEIAAGITDDCNGNGIPDDCEPPQIDCNKNGVADGCDLTSGTSGDCNNDEVPDDCQPNEDCNNDGLRDICEIGMGLSKDCNGNLVPDDCDITSGTSPDANGDGIPDECCFPPTSAQPEMVPSVSGTLVASAKNRYLSFRAGDPGRMQAIRVTFEDLPGPYAAWNGTQMWVGEPRPIGELGGCVEPVGNCAPFPTFNAATLECSLTAPLYRDWSQLGMIHVYHEGIIPGATYSISVVNVDCDPTIETTFSPAIIVSTSAWGDLVGPFDASSGLWTASDGSIDIVTDIVAAIQVFEGNPLAPSKTRADIQFPVVDFALNFGDVVDVLTAFEGGTYRWTPSTPTGPCAP